MADQGFDDVNIVAVNGSARDDEMRERVFRFAVDKISAQFETKMDRCFLEFEIGGQSIEGETEEVIETKKMKKVKKEDGTTEEKEVIETVNTKMTRIKKIPVMRYMSYQKRSLKAKQSEKFLYDRIDGYWSGSYQDLAQEYLTVRVWCTRLLGGNVLMGEAREPFLTIADTKVERVLHVRRKTAGARDENVCEVRFKCEFQEWFNFQIKFQNWEVSFTKDEMERRTAEAIKSKKPQPSPSGALSPAQAACLCYKTSLTYQIRRSRQNISDALLDSLCCCMASDRAALRLRNNLKTPVGSGSDAVAVVSYPGTRNWLEDEELAVTWSKSVLCGLCCCATDVASTTVPLQGTLDYGYILAPLEVRKDACSCYCLRQACRRGIMSLFASCQVCFGPTCNCLRNGYSTLGCELSQEAKAAQARAREEERSRHLLHMQLAGVVTCDTMPRYRQQGTVDPVRRNGLLALAQSNTQNTYLVCRVIRAKGLSCVAEFKETINPSVSVEWAGIQKRTKVMSNTTNPRWDYDVHFKLPDQNGPPRKFEDFPESVRQTKLVLSVWDEDGLSRSSLGYTEVDFRSIYERRVEKSIQVFSSDSRVPHLVYEAKLPLQLPCTDAAEDKQSREHKRLLDAEHTHLEVLIYFDRVDSFTVDNRRVAAPREEITVAQAERTRIRQYARARVLWDESLRYVENRDQRYFAFFGKDEYTGDCHFLPTFVKPMHPPANMKDLSEIFYYVFSMEVQQKPAVEVDDAKMRRALKHRDPCSPLLHKDVWVWSDPFFFFEKKKGDIKDHCVLLCNFLLGLGLPKDQFNAFVCQGTARSKKAGKAVPHVWVMTQEMFPHYSHPVVRFWELKTGETVVLEGTRFAEVYNPDVHRARQGDSQLVGISPEGNVQGVSADEVLRQHQHASRGEDGDEEGAEAEDGVRDMAWDKVGRRMNEDLAKFDYTDDAALLELTTSVPALDTASTAPSEPLPLPPAAAAADAGLHASTTTNIYASASVAEVDDVREGARHRQSLLQAFIAEQERRFPNQRDRFWDTTDSKKKRATAYESLDVVFNHECLFGNLQQSNPEVIMYEFEKEKRWSEFAPANWRECFGYQALQPFYENKAIVSILSAEREMSLLRADMTHRLVENLVTHRSYYHQAETLILDKFDFSGTVGGLENTADYARQRLSLEARHGMRDAGLRTLDAARAQDEQSRARLSGRVGPELSKLRSKVQRNLKQGLEFQERLFHFKHADANRIGDQVKTQCADLLAFPDSIAPRYQVFVDIERLPGQICPVRVLVMVMYGHAKQ